MNKLEREARRRDVCRQYHESGMSQAAFCEENGIARSTLGYWLRVESGANKPEARRMVVPVGSIAAGELRRSVRISAKTGVVVEVDLPASEAELSSILGMVSRL